MSEGDRYREYDPKERVVELEHEVAALRKELEEERRLPANERVETLTRRVKELEAALTGGRSVHPPLPDDPQMSLARSRESLVWQLVGLIVGLGVDVVLAIGLLMASSSWGFAFLFAGSYFLFMIVKTRLELQKTERGLAMRASMRSARRVRVAGERSADDRQGWEEQQAAEEEAASEKGWRDGNDQ